MAPTYTDVRPVGAQLRKTKSTLKLITAPPPDISRDLPTRQRTGEQKSGVRAVGGEAEQQTTERQRKTEAKRGKTSTCVYKGIFTMQSEKGHDVENVLEEKRCWQTLGDQHFGIYRTQYRVQQLHV
ncbi:hypothetical protein NDU88_005386 [Pleurodeles waltl]|uniref:Uncharacterized protein n=1 Tax=Pleurodeles waltl TaxID=8319 RepID=A0AAV7NMC7_PLEWA|nr:hypothetical protein NDU88_005386 [Pleurodeles waltl]